MAHFDLRRPSIGIPSSLFNTQLNASKNLTYTFIYFQQKVPPIRLFPPILLLIFKEISHLYFYSEPSSIRNSRVPINQSMTCDVRLQLAELRCAVASCKIFGKLLGKYWDLKQCL